MKIDQSFAVRQPRDEVWEFFDRNAVRAALCIPGAQEASKIRQDCYRIVIAQRMGAVSATFDLTTEINEKKVPQSMAISAIGRSIKGARGDLRATAQVELRENSDETEVHITGTVFLGGMLGSMGHRVIAGRISELTRELAVGLSKELEQWSKQR